MDRGGRSVPVAFPLRELPFIVRRYDSIGKSSRRWRRALVNGAGIRPELEDRVPVGKVGNESL